MDFPHVPAARAFRAFTPRSGAPRAHFTALALHAVAPLLLSAWTAAVIPLATRT